MVVLPPLLRPRRTDEYTPPPPPRAQRRATARAAEALRDRAAESRVDPRAYAEGRSATAVALRALDAEAGGGFFVVPEDAERADDVAADVFDDPDGPPLIDVQTHLVNPARFVGGAAKALGWFLGFSDPDRWAAGVDPQRLGPSMWAELVFARSETAAALITLPPGSGDDRLVDNDEVALCRSIVDAMAGPGRVLTHSIVHPNLPGEVAAMAEWAQRCEPSGWKCYPLYGGDPESPGGVGWRLDDDVGTEFLERVRDLGPRLLAVHKGISGPVPDSAPEGASPSDVGPAAVAFPELTFVIYHSGYEPAWDEGPYSTEGRGVDALIRSVGETGVGNVYAELGSTWHLVLRKPEQAAHVLGKLLASFGPERIVWGTDSVWYGSPQPLIDAFRAFQIPERMQEEFGYPALTDSVKRRILSANASALYAIEPRPRADDWVARAADELARAFPGR